MIKTQELKSVRDKIKTDSNESSVRNQPMTESYTSDNETVGKTLSSHRVWTRRCFVYLRARLEAL